MTKRKLWNKLTKMNGGKSKSKNYDVAETLNDLIEVIASEFLASGGMLSESLDILTKEADKAWIKMKKQAVKAKTK